MQGFFHITTSGRQRESVSIRASLVSSIESTYDVSIRWPADTRCLIHMQTGETYGTEMRKADVEALMEKALSQPA